MDNPPMPIEFEDTVFPHYIRNELEGAFTEPLSHGTCNLLIQHFGAHPQSFSSYDRYEWLTNEPETEELRVMRLAENRIEAHSNSIFHSIGIHEFPLMYTAQEVEATVASLTELLYIVFPYKPQVIGTTLSASIYNPSDKPQPTLTVTYKGENSYEFTCTQPTTNGDEQIARLRILKNNRRQIVAYRITTFEDNHNNHTNVRTLFVDIPNDSYSIGGLVQASSSFIKESAYLYRRLRFVDQLARDVTWRRQE